MKKQPLSKPISTRSQFLAKSQLTPASSFTKDEFIQTVHSIEFILIDDACRLDSIVAALFYAIVRRNYLVNQKKPNCEVLIVVPRTKESFNFCHQALVLVIAFQADDISVDDLFAFRDTHPELIFPAKQSTFAKFYTYINYNLHIHASTVRDNGFVIGFDRGGIMEIDKVSPKKKRKQKMPTLPTSINSVSTLSTQTLLSQTASLRNINISEFVQKCGTLSEKQKQDDYYRLYSSFSIAAIVYHFLQDRYPIETATALCSSNHLSSMILCAIQCETHKFRRLFSNDYYVATKMKNELPLADVFQMNGCYKTTSFTSKMIFKPKFYREFMRNVPSKRAQTTHDIMPRIDEDSELKKPAGYGYDDEDEDEKKQYKWLQTSLITQTGDAQAHGTKNTGWDDPEFYINCALNCHLQIVSSCELQLSFAPIEYDSSARNCIRSIVGFNKVYVVVWDYNAEKELMNTRVIQVWFANNEYANEYAKMLANDAHVGANGAFINEECDDKSIIATIYQKTKPRHSWNSSELCLDTLIAILKRVQEKKNDTQWLSKIFK